MATSRPVRIVRPRATPSAPLPAGPSVASEPSAPRTAPTHRPNRAGSQRVIRLSTFYVVVLAALYLGLVLYGRTAPGGSSSAELAYVLLFTAVFAAFALGGILVTLTPAPRSVEVATDHVTVVGRWGRRHRFPPLDRLHVRVARRYPAGILASEPVESVEVWGDDTPVRSYLVGAELFEGAPPFEPDR